MSNEERPAAAPTRAEIDEFLDGLIGVEGSRGDLTAGPWSRASLRILVEATLRQWPPAARSGETGARSRP